MAKFTFKFGKEQEVREGDRVSIGTRSTASFTLEDPLAADIHCDIVVRGSEFVVMDRGGSLGTFVNGVRVVEAHPLQDGDQIVCAVSRLNVTIKGDEITINQDRSRFYYDDKKDGLDLSRREVAFGRFRPVSMGNWIVAFVMLLLFPLSYFGATSELLLDPGPTWHGKSDAYHAAMAQLDEDHQDCNACHENFSTSGTPTTKCLNCHQEDVGSPDIYPYFESKDWAEHPDACILCHTDHWQAHHSLLRTADWRNLWENEFDGDKDRQPRAGVSSISPVDVGVLYNTFSHADHMKKEVDGQPLDCSSCHKVYEDSVGLADRAREGDRVREFAPVDYESCIACHSGSFQNVPDLKSNWHGTDEEGKHCLTCHSELNDAAMRQVEFTSATRSYSLVGRSHVAEMKAAEAAGGQKCADCHRNGEELNGGRGLSGRRFEHVTHALNLQPADDAAKMRLSGSADAPKTGECAHCHSDVMQSESLASESPHHYANQSCSSCHTTGRVEETRSREQRMKRNEFPHSRHMQVEGGCYACHEFNSDNPEMDVMTPPKIKDCSACHTTHDNIAGGKCDDCHKKGDAVYAAKPLPWERRPDKGYSHFSPGHIGPTNAGKCTDCHGEEIWQAKTIDAITIPPENDPRCRDCHAKERFHTR